MAQSSLSPSPHHFIFIVVIVVAILLIPLLFPEAEESVLPSSKQELNPIMLLIPVILLLVLRYLSTQEKGLRVDADASTIHRVSGSSVGIALVLVVVAAMIWYQSTVEDA
eukprot:c13931_g2_i1 orf=388-717(+)